VTSPTDEEIQGRLEKLLKEDANLSGQDVSVEFASETASLSGTVNSLWRKQHAEEIVGQASAVQRTENWILVVTTREAEDRRIAEDIFSAMEKHPLFGKAPLAVQVGNGEVSLSGVVGSLSARRAAYEIALRTAGVIAIHDQLSVASPSTGRGRPLHAPDD
jgi:osmotically-inducible protein OsmY